MKKLIAGLLLVLSIGWAQSNAEGPVVAVQCSATRTTNCTPTVNGSGAYVPSVPATSLPIATSSIQGISILGLISACVGAPGDTTGSYRTLCIVPSTGALWACTNAGGCTLAAHWSASGDSQFASAQAPGNLACAYHGDTTINQLTVTGATNTAPIVFTVSASPLTAGYYVGEKITASASNPASYNSVTYTVTALDATTVTVDNSIAPGASWTSGTKLSLTCANQVTDAITATPFSFTTVTVPTGYLSTGDSSIVRVQFRPVYAAALPTIGFIKLVYASTPIYSVITSVSSSAAAASQFSRYGSVSWEIYALDSTRWWTSTISQNITATETVNWLNSLRGPVTVDQTADRALGVQWGYTATGIGAATCNDAGNKCGITTVTGSVGQTCALSSFNGAGGTNATATVALTGTDTIANGTAIVITNTGSGYTGTSTAATAGSGTATCSGTAAISMPALGGAQGNAIEQLSISINKR